MPTVADDGTVEHVRAVLEEGPGPGCRLITDRAEPGLLAGEVRVAVAVASVCGTDAAFHASGDAGCDLAMTFPRTMGHEVSGTVVELGPGTPTGPAGRPLQLGTRVAVETHIQCGSCWFCSQAWVISVRQEAAGPKGSRRPD